MASSPPPQPHDPFYVLTRKIRPDLDSFSITERTARITDILGCLLAIPLAIAGLAWLVAATDGQLIGREWKVMLLMGVLMLVLNKLHFFFISNLSPGGGLYGNAKAALDGIIHWSAVFLFGPTGLWIDLTMNGSGFTVNLARSKSTDRRWNLGREVTSSIISVSLFPLIALSVYRMLGGTIPFSGLTLKTLLLGISMLLVQMVLDALYLWIFYLAYSLWSLRTVFSQPALVSVANLVLLALGIPLLSNLFAIPLASAYTQVGLLAYLVLALGVILVAWMGRRFSPGAGGAGGVCLAAG
jgi:hypothetical protein